MRTKIDEYTAFDDVKNLVWQESAVDIIPRISGVVKFYGRMSCRGCGCKTHPGYEFIQTKSRFLIYLLYLGRAVFFFWPEKKKFQSYETIFFVMKTDVLIKEIFFYKN